MTFRGTWAGALLGLAVGAALGVVLLNTRFQQAEVRDVVSDQVQDLGGEGLQLVSGSSGSSDPVGPGGQLVGAPSVTQPEVDLQQERGNAIVRATKKVAPAVVSINVIQQQALRSPSMMFFQREGRVVPPQLYREVQNMGSGVIVSADGMVVTNQHVIQGAVRIVVTLSDGRQFDGTVLDAVALYDLAVLHIDGDDLPVAQLTPTEDLDIGEWAIAIGSPYGYLLADTQPTVTVGVISALNRDIKSSQRERIYLGMIQTDAAINPGNSGGPLVNTAGEVIGINTFIFSDSGGSVGIGFAVPAARVLNVVDEVRTYGHFRERFVGMRLASLTPPVLQALGATDPRGLAVLYVMQDSPAWKAGIRPADIIREIDGQLLDSQDVITRRFYDANVGDKMMATVERESEQFTAEILIEEWR